MGENCAIFFMLLGGACVGLGAYVAIEISRHRAIVRVAELAAEDARRQSSEGGR